MNRVERTVRGWILPLLGTFTDSELTELDRVVKTGLPRCQDAELADTIAAPPPSAPDSAPAVPVEEGDEWIVFGGKQ